MEDLLLLRSCRIAPMVSPRPMLNLAHYDQLNRGKAVDAIANMLAQMNIDRKTLLLYFAGASIPHLLFVRRILEISALSSPKILRLVPQERYLILNRQLSSHVERTHGLKGTVANDLIALGCRLAVRGCGQLGHIVQMTPQEVTAWAAAVPSIRRPGIVASKLEILLAPHDLSLNMRAPGWRASRAPSLEEQIADRDARREREAGRPGRAPPAYLRLIPFSGR